MMVLPLAPDLRALPSLSVDERRELPDMAAIYFVLAGDTVLYVGQSTSLRQRWVAHHRLTQLNAYGNCRIAWMHVGDTNLLDDLERACIEHFSPILNNKRIPEGVRHALSEDAEYDESLTIRLSSTLKSRITEAARKDRRRPGDWVRLKLEEAVEETRREQP